MNPVPVADPAGVATRRMAEDVRRRAPGEPDAPGRLRIDGCRIGALVGEEFSLHGGAECVLADGSIATAHPMAREGQPEKEKEPGRGSWLLMDQDVVTAELLR